MKNTIDFLIPAHNEEATVAGVTAACLDVAMKFSDSCTVTVIADHCSDNTAERAEAVGANVIQRTGSQPSKAQAIQMGIDATKGDIVALFDADCIGLREDHLMHLLRPILNSQVALSVGVIDYGKALAPIVQRIPWSSGQRVLKRESFDWQDSRLRGYMIEMVMNESIGRSGGLVYSSVLDGVKHKSKLRKLNVVDGINANFKMWKSIADSMGDIDKDGLGTYIKGIRLRDSSEKIIRPVISNWIGVAALKAASQIFN